MKEKKKPRNKPHFAHDENLEFISLKKECSRIALFISFVKLMKKAGAKDPVVIRACNKNDYHIITHNTRDFMYPKTQVKVGIICVGLRNDDEWIPKFKKLLKTLRKYEDFYNKSILIDNGITIIDRVSKDTKVI